MSSLTPDTYGIERRFFLGLLFRNRVLFLQIIYIAWLIPPLSGQADSHVKNSKHFKQLNEN